MHYNMTLNSHVAKPPSRSGEVADIATRNDIAFLLGPEEMYRGNLLDSPPPREPIISLSRDEVQELYHLALAETHREAGTTDDAVVDSGASAHFTKNRDQLENLMKDIIVAVKNATGGTSDSEGSGEMSVEYIDANGEVRRLIGS